LRSLWTLCRGRHNRHYADLALKERALARTTPPHSTPGRYRPADTVLAFLEAL